MKLCDYMNDWIENVKSATVRESTLVNLRSMLRTIKKYPIAEMEFTAIRTSHVNAFLATAAKNGVARGSILNMRATLGDCYKCAIVDGDITANPVALSKMPLTAHPTKTVEAFTDEEQKKLAPFFKSTDSKRKCEEFMLETGLRIGEALALDWKDVDIEAAIPFVNIHSTMTRITGGKHVVGDSAKTSAGNRKIPISKRAAEILKSIPKTDGPIFKSIHGKRLDERQVRHDLKNVCNMAGIPHRGPHALRHTFATNQFYKGTNIKVLSKLLGHSNTSITYNTYINLYGDGFDDMAKAVS